jgi:hypothetical protein
MTYQAEATSAAQTAEEILAVAISVAAEILVVGISVAAEILVVGISVAAIQAVAISKAALAAPTFQHPFRR